MPYEVLKVQGRLQGQQAAELMHVLDRENERKLKESARRAWKGGKKFSASSPHADPVGTSLLLMTRVQ